MRGGRANKSRSIFGLGAQAVYICQAARQNKSASRFLQSTKLFMSIQLDLPTTFFAVASLPLTRYSAVLTAVQAVEGYVSVTRDKDEITLIIAESTWQDLAAHFPEAQVQGRRRMIRFDTVLDFSVVGFIAEISRALADADISILSISTYRTDAVLVHEASFDKAVKAVRHALVMLQHTHLSQH